MFFLASSNPSIMHMCHIYDQKDAVKILSHSVKVTPFLLHHYLLQLGFCDGSWTNPKLPVSLPCVPSPPAAYSASAAIDIHTYFCFGRLRLYGVYVWFIDPTRLQNS